MRGMSDLGNWSLLVLAGFLLAVPPLRSETKEHGIDFKNEEKRRSAIQKILPEDCVHTLHSASPQFTLYETIRIEFKNQQETTTIATVHELRPTQQKTARVETASIRALWNAKDLVYYFTPGLPELCAIKDTNLPIPESPCLFGLPDCTAKLYLRFKETKESFEFDYRVLTRPSDRQRITAPNLDWRWEWFSELDKEDLLRLRLNETARNISSDLGSQQLDIQLTAISPSDARGSCPDGKSETDPRCRTERLRGPVFRPDGGRGAWTMEELPGARIVKGSCQSTTREDGTFCWPQGKESKKKADGTICDEVVEVPKTIDVVLATDRFEIYGPDGNIVRHRSAQPPLVLHSLDDPLRGLEISVALFRIAASVYQFFGELVTIREGSLEPVKIHQPIGFSQESCQASWQANNITLPLLCRNNPLHEPKALCPEIVTHEIAHEIANSMLYLAMGDSNSAIEHRLGEQLSDFAAMMRQRHPVIGRLCSSDFREPFGRVERHREPSSHLLLPRDQNRLAHRLWLVTKELSCSGRFGERPESCDQPTQRLDVSPKARDMMLKLLLTTIIHFESPEDSLENEAVRSTEKFIEHLFAIVEQIDLEKETVNSLCRFLTFKKPDSADADRIFPELCRQRPQPASPSCRQPGPWYPEVSCQIL